MSSWPLCLWRKQASCDVMGRVSLTAIGRSGGVGNQFLAQLTTFHRNLTDLDSFAWIWNSLDTMIYREISLFFFYICKITIMIEFRSVHNITALRWNILYTLFDILHLRQVFSFNSRWSLYSCFVHIWTYRFYYKDSSFDFAW